MIATAGVDSGVCVNCKRGWPQATFKNYDESDETLPLKCDQCVAGAEIAAKIDEAQSIEGAVLIRQVVVTGIKSGTRVTGFRYPTHVKRDALAITDLVVTFEGGAEYLYENVPTVVAETWMEASSFGTHFIQQIKNSYDCHRIN